MRKRRWKALVVGACFTFGTLVSIPTSVLADEVSELRQQLADQRRAMEMMERRLLQLEGKEQTRSENEPEIGYERAQGLRLP